MSLLDLININLSYGKEYSSQILRNVNVSIERSELVAIMGPSGAGKSSLLYVMSGLETPNSGKVIFNGNDITALSSDKQADLRINNFGFIYQFFNLIPILTAEENIVLPLKIANKNVNDYTQKIDKIIEDVGLTDKRHLKPSQLSGGQQQRVAIARALINDPKIIFADEPTGSLDRKNSVEIMQLLTKLSKCNNTAVVMVTHNPELCKYTTRVINMIDGQVK